MHRFGLSASTVVVCVLAFLAAPAAADPFCDVLLRVGASASANFAAIRGNPDEPGGQQYGRALVLPGSLMTPATARCSVYANAQGEQYFYTCYFNGTGNQDADVGALATRVAACLGQPAPPLSHESQTPVPSDPLTRQTVANAEYDVAWTQFHDYDPIPGWSGLSLTVSAATN